MIAPHGKPERVAGVYLAFSAVWILGSDWLLEAMVGDRSTGAALQTVKGLVFVSATALLIYWMARRELRRLERHHLWLRKVFDDAPVLIAYVTPELRYRFTNEGYARLYGRGGESLDGLQFTEVVGAANAERVAPVLRRALAGEEIAFEGEIVDSDGQPHWLHANYVLDLDERGRAEGVLIVIVDLTERRAAEAEIAYRANYDALTGLANRNLLLERLTAALAGRTNGHVALLFVDLDEFKQMNDTLGHVTGDRLLKNVAQRLAGCVHEGDTVARLSSDIFILLLSHIEQPSDAGIVAAKATAAIAEPFHIDELEVRMTASVGIALAPQDGEAAEALFACADLALSQAKQSGRGSHVFFAPVMHRAAHERRLLKDEMHRALQRGEFRVHYQPVVEMDSGRVSGAEVLVRWQHPQRGLVPPGLFIPLAEQSGIIRELGAWVFEEACRQLAVWQAAGHRWRLAVNVSSGQLPQPMSPQWLKTVLQAHGLAADALTLEITESALLGDTEATLAWIMSIREMGFHIALDDFGTGYSSLTYLKRFPFHVVKVDQSFVRDMVDDHADRTLVDTILAMARSLGLNVVAEGVETEEQLGLLRDMGCHHAQGYFFARPAPADEFPGWVARIEQRMPE
ncbi:MAG: EAL domain-containing protein [Rhodocyclales bacterium]|nr:EAL domain-containing protein [Rhodocyclales bacterium]